VNSAEPAQPSRPGCLLVALSHPDDEVGCAGTIAAHRALGVRVVLLFLTKGEATESLGPLTVTEVAEARVQHATRVARLLDCELRFLDFADTRIEANADAVHRVARAIAEIQPDAVITWGDAWLRGMRHPDHQQTGEIVRGAITVARIKRSVAPIEPHRGVAAVFTLRDRHSQLPCAAIDVSQQFKRVLEVGRFYFERVRWPDPVWLAQRLEDAGKRWGVRAAEELDAWESTPGLRASLLGDYLPV
jgi:LmbE family N-acetylglucosaminyl deacetylase